MAETRRLNRRTSWCCSITHPPCKSPDYCRALPSSNSKRKPKPNRKKPTRSNSLPYDSPQGLKLSFVGKIDPRKILSPGRVSPIDSDPTAGELVQSAASVGTAAEEQRAAAALPVTAAVVEVECARSERSASFRGLNDVTGGGLGSGSGHFGLDPGGGGGDSFDVRLNLRGRRGGTLVLEMSSDVLMANSEVLGALVAEYRKGAHKVNRIYSNGNGGRRSRSMKVCRIEVPDVENIGVFRDTIELMFEDDITSKLLKHGAYRAISILEVSADLKFSRGALSCLNYLGAVPWTEEEEEKLRRIMTIHKFDETATRDILDRLYIQEPSEDSQWSLTKQLLWSITTCTDPSARNELKSLVKGLVSKSSVYDKQQPALNKADVYVICQSCLDSLACLFDEASSSQPNTDTGLAKKSTPAAARSLVERIAMQVDNVNWLLEILLEWQMAEEFVDMWGNQEELRKLHEGASPLFRYELSRVSAALFIAMGTRRLHCQFESRSMLFKTWFCPMLQDFGWIKRCKKGLDLKVLEEAIGQSLLTLPLAMQHELFMEWFSYFSKHGNDCINLGKAFQMWWRRSFLRGSETHGVESR
ncbi:unnamed protein product [Linum trigynum]|uniref:At3g05675-like ankyrin-like domain-containing protein n=1 Tax=Linum trigynum TaxID=586398 RepID=A0AAV2E1W9_9ROSI